MPEVVDLGVKETRLGSDGIIKGLGPANVMPPGRLAHVVALHHLFEAMMSGAGHCTITAANNAGIIKTVQLQKLAMRCPGETGRTGSSTVLKSMADTGRGGNA